MPRIVLAVKPKRLIIHREVDVFRKAIDRLEYLRKRSPTLEKQPSLKRLIRKVSMAVEKGAKTAVVWLLFTLPLSLLEGGVLSERPAAVKGAPALRGEATSRSPPLTRKELLQHPTNPEILFDDSLGHIHALSCFGKKIRARACFHDGDFVHALFSASCFATS